MESWIDCGSLSPDQSRTALATIFANGIIRLHRRLKMTAKIGESSEISPDDVRPRLDHSAETVLSVSTRVNASESSTNHGEKEC